MTACWRSITCCAVVPCGSSKARIWRQAAGMGWATGISTSRGGDTTGALEQHQSISRKGLAKAVELRRIE